jgi:iron complex transport system permease protein
MNPQPAATRRLLFAIALLALAVLAVGSLAFGDFSPLELWRAWRDDDPTVRVGLILWEIRLPRVLVAMLAGAALSASGLVMQAFFRNSLASPGLLGVSAGATTGAVCAIWLGFSAQTLAGGWLAFLGENAVLWLMPLAAIAGAFAATGVTLTLARRGAGTERLLLGGIAVNAMLGAVTSYVLSDSVLSQERQANILFWLLGGLERCAWEHVAVAAPILIFAALLIPLGRPLDLLCLGAQEAQSLGVNVAPLRRRLIVISTVLTALATSAVGTVGFVGLVVPHILRLLLGPEHRRLVPWSLAGGAGFMLACDIIGRCAGNLRIGIVTAFVGGPFFLLLLRKRTL